MKFLIVIGIIIIHTPLHAQQGQRWAALNPGNYKVGFKIYECYDYGRHIAEDTVTYKSKAETVQTISIYVWYPATNSHNAMAMQYRDYVYLTKQVNIVRPLTALQKKEAEESAKWMIEKGANIGLNDAEFAELLSSPANGVKNALPVKGKFPVILCGLQGGPSLNYTLMEFLASKGYIVVASAASIRIGRMEAFNIQRALIERLADMEYMTAFAHNLPNADNEHTGVIGINFEGMVALLYQMKNKYAQAIVSIDGWEGKTGGMYDIKRSALFDFNNMRVPYFSVMQDEANPPAGLRLSHELLDSLTTGQSYYHVLNEIGHVYLINSMYMLPKLPTEKVAAYQLLYKNVGFFLDEYLKNIAGSIVNINQAIEKDSTSKTGIIKQAFKK